MIPIAELKDETTFEFKEIDPAEINLSGKKLKSFKNIEARIKLYKIAKGIAANFQVNFVINFACVRCLETCTKEFDVDFHLDYMEGTDPFLKVENVELKSGDIYRVYYNSPHLDMSIGIREAIILFLPIAPLCKEDCAGLCPVCGQNLNERNCGCKVEKVEVFTPKSINNKGLSPQQNKKYRRNKGKI